MREVPAIVEQAINIEAAAQELDALLGEIRKGEALIEHGSRILMDRRYQAGIIFGQVRKTFPERGPRAKGWGEFVKARGVSLDTALRYIETAQQVAARPELAERRSFQDVYQELGLAIEPPARKDLPQAAVNVALRQNQANDLSDPGTGKQIRPDHYEDLGERKPPSADQEERYKKGQLSWDEAIERAKSMPAHEFLARSEEVQRKEEPPPRSKPAPQPPPAKAERETLFPESEAGKVLASKPVGHEPPAGEQEPAQELAAKEQPAAAKTEPADIKRDYKPESKKLTAEDRRCNLRVLVSSYLSQAPDDHRPILLQELADLAGGLPPALQAIAEMLGAEPTIMSVGQAITALQDGVRPSGEDEDRDALIKSASQKGYLVDPAAFDAAADRVAKAEEEARRACARADKAEAEVARLERMVEQPGECARCELTAVEREELTKFLALPPSSPWMNVMARVKTPAIVSRDIGAPKPASASAPPAEEKPAQTEPPAALACNEEAPSGGNQGPRRCYREPGHPGKHIYREIDPNRMWLIGATDTVPWQPKEAAPEPADAGPRVPDSLTAAAREVGRRHAESRRRPLNRDGAELAKLWKQIGGEPDSGGHGAVAALGPEQKDALYMSYLTSFQWKQEQQDKEGQP